METVIEYETNAMANASNSNACHKPNLGTVNSGSPIGILPTRTMFHLSSIFMYFDNNVPPTTTSNSIGIGIFVRLATRGFSISLLNTRIVIVNADNMMAAKFMSSSC